jgi:hypothetical protein
VVIEEKLASSHGKFSGKCFRVARLSISSNTGLHRYMSPVSHVYGTLLCRVSVRCPAAVCWLGPMQPTPAQPDPAILSALANVLVIVRGV